MINKPSKHSFRLLGKTRRTSLQARQSEVFSLLVFTINDPRFENVRSVWKAVCKEFEQYLSNTLVVSRFGWPLLVVSILYTN